MSELNKDFLARMKELLGGEYNDFCESLARPMEKAIYVNTRKISVDDFLHIVDFDCNKIPYEKAGFYVDDSKKGRHPLHHAGAFYIQEPSAMFTVNCFEFKGDEKVLDMCASPGGKTIQIANRVPNGIVVSNEFVKSRSEILFSNIERMGLTNVIVTNDKPENLAKAYANCFDVCLVDAPCSGEGMFRRGEQVSEQWNPGLIEMNSKRQLDILEQANKALKTGGVLIYSTCTYSTEENEQVVKNFLSRHDYVVEEITTDDSWEISNGIGLEQAKRLYPHKVKGEGQFVAKLRKRETNDLIAVSSLKPKSNKLAEKFIFENLNKQLNIFEQNGNCFAVIDNNFLKKDINYVSFGVKIGVVVKDRFEPHHNLFTSFGNEISRELNFDYHDKNVMKYLHGDVIDCDMSNGYGVFKINNIPLGGFKISNGQFKNLYPKGLRNFN